MPFTKEQPGKGRKPLTPDNIDAYLDKTALDHNGIGAERFRYYLDHTRSHGRKVSWTTLAALMHVGQYVTVQRWASLIKQKDHPTNETPPTD